MSLAIIQALVRISVCFESQLLRSKHRKAYLLKIKYSVDLGIAFRHIILCEMKYFQATFHFLFIAGYRARVLGRFRMI